MKSPPDKWGKMSWEQLVYVHEHNVEDYNSEIERRFDIFLYLAGLCVAKNGGQIIKDMAMGIASTDATADNKKAMTLTERVERELARRQDTIQSVGSVMDEMDKFMRGDIMFLHPKDDETSIFRMETEMAVAYARHFTRFMDEPFTLISLPASTIEIKDRMFELPAGLLVNISYQQYNNAQNWLTKYWTLMQYLMPTTDEEGNVKKKPQLSEKQLEQIVTQIKEAQMHFIANMIAPMYNVKDEKSGVERMTAIYDARDEDDLVAFLDTNCPKGLFSILYQQLQSCLRVFQKKFPNLFTEQKGDKNGDVFVANLGTVNSVMKYAGFQNANAVYEENAVFIFKWLDTMSHEAKEMEKINQRAKVKRR